jgi:hypothetical protein
MAGASPVPIELMKKVIDKLNLTELTVAYGMSKFIYSQDAQLISDMINA